METPPATKKYKNHRFPVEIISHAVWTIVSLGISLIAPRTPPTRERQRRMQRVKSWGQTQRFLAAYGLISPHFRLRRPRLATPQYRHELAQRFPLWDEITGLALVA